jgi:hypothetical protein
VLEAALLLAAFAAGVTGAWSPCGFSMVETLAPQGYAGRLGVTLAACATFAVGALAGGVATFAGLSAVGGALGAGGGSATAVAAAIALVAALGEARGARILPQVRRQVPESWRRVLPLPLAAGGYGVLLGLGFTTFILSFAVWALAGVSVALGDPALGVLIGLGFGAGRVLPVVVLAPAARRGWAASAHAAMAERPAILRMLRGADAVALGLCALALAGGTAQAAGGGARAAAATPALVAAGTDPSVDGGLLAFQSGAAGVLAQGGTATAAPGPHPSVGGGRLAWIGAGTVEVRAPADPAFVVTLPAPGADAVAVGADWVVWRARANGRDVLSAAPLNGSAPPRAVATGALAGELGRPALAGTLLLFHAATRRAARIDALDLGTGVRRTLRREARAQLLNPTALGDRLLYVRATYRRQQVRIGPLADGRPSGDRVLYGTVPTGRRDAGYEPGVEHHRHGHPSRMWPRPRRGVHDTLWTTALAADAAYVTRLRQRTGKPVQPALLRLPR